MKNPMFSVSVLVAAVVLAGCGDSSSSSSSSNSSSITSERFSCESSGNVSALTAEDVLAVTSTSNCLVRFSRSSPGDLTPIGKVSGTGGAIVGLDFRPDSGELFALTSLGELLLLDPATGETQPVTSSIGEREGTRFDMDFSPAANALRIISGARENFRLDAEGLDVNAMQAAVVDGTVGYLQGVVATAYDNVNPGQDGTRMFVIDVTSRNFYQQQPNEGLLQFIGELFPGAESVQVKGYNVFTASDGSNEHYAVFTVDGETGLYTVDPDSAATGFLRTLPAPPQGEASDYVDLTVAASEEDADQREFTLYERDGNNDFFLNIFDLGDDGSTVTFSDSHRIAGLLNDDVLLGFDLRTTSEELGGNGRYALANSGNLYAIADPDPAPALTGGDAQATRITTLSEGLVGSRFDIDFNPRADLLRVISSAGQNLRVNLEDGREVDGEVREAGFALADGTVRLLDTREPMPVATGYHPDTVLVGDPELTVDFQFVIDARTSALTRVVVPDDGALMALSERLMEGLTLPTAGDIQQSMDIAPDGTAFAALRQEGERASTLYTLDLESGAATTVGVIGGADMPEGVNAISVFIPKPD